MGQGASKMKTEETPLPQISCSSDVPLLHISMMISCGLHHTNSHYTDGQHEQGTVRPTISKIHFVVPAKSCQIDCEDRAKGGRGWGNAIEEKGKGKLAYYAVTVI